MGNPPNYNAFLGTVWGFGPESIGLLPLMAAVSNVLVGGNPPYTNIDFLSIYPKFGGTPVTVTCNADGTTATLTGVSSLGGLLPGMLVAGPVGGPIQKGSTIVSASSAAVSTNGNTVNGNANITVANPQGIAIGMNASGSGIATGATVLGIAGNTLELSLPCTATGAAVALSFQATPTIVLSLPTTQAVNGLLLTIYVAPLIPLVVLNTFIVLASNSVWLKHYQENWLFCMALFIAHYATLWLQGEAAGPNSTPAQAAASGLAIGIKVAASAGDVSKSMEVVKYEDWGSYNLTLYGQQFLTFAAPLGSGPMLFL